MTAFSLPYRVQTQISPLCSWKRGEREREGHSFFLRISRKNSANFYHGFPSSSPDSFVSRTFHEIERFRINTFSESVRWSGKLNEGGREKRRKRKKKDRGIPSKTETFQFDNRVHHFAVFISAPRNNIRSMIFLRAGRCLEPVAGTTCRPLNSFLSFGKIPPIVFSTLSIFSFDERRARTRAPSSQRSRVIGRKGRRGPFESTINIRKILYPTIRISKYSFIFFDPSRYNLLRNLYSICDIRFKRIIPRMY